MKLSQESQLFWHKLETELNIIIPDYVKNALQ